MGLFLGIAVIVIGIAGWLLIGFGNSMQDAPSQNAMSPWPILNICLFVGIILIVTHYHPISLHW